MDPRFYKDDFFPTFAEEIEYIRSPFYELAKGEQLSKENA